jgi:hypothetical protein
MILFWSEVVVCSELPLKHTRACLPSGVATGEYGPVVVVKQIMGQMLL